MRFTNDLIRWSIIRSNRITSSFNRYGHAFDGMLEHRGGRFHIFCNLDRVEKRGLTRGPVHSGHELGHFYIDDHRSALESGVAPSHRSCADFESKLIVEQEADYFAVNLLMPESLFLEKGQGELFPAFPPLGLARTFGTSVTSTAIRYATLGLSPCVVIKWNQDKVAWRWFADHLWNAGFRRIIDDKHESWKGRPRHCLCLRAAA